MFNVREADEEEERKKHEGTKVSSREEYRYSFIGRRGREKRRERNTRGQSKQQGKMLVLRQRCR